MITIPTIVVAVILLAVLVLAKKIINTRRHIIIGYMYLKFARNIFDEAGEIREVKILEDTAMPHLLELRYSVASRFLWILVTIISICVLLITTIMGINLLFVNIGAALMITYTLVAVKETIIDYYVVNDVCDACEADLIVLGHTDVYQQMINDPPNVENDG